MSRAPVDAWSERTMHVPRPPAAAAGQEALLASSRSDSPAEGSASLRANTARAATANGTTSRDGRLQSTRTASGFGRRVGGLTPKHGTAGSTSGSGTGGGGGVLALLSSLPPVGKDGRPLNSSTSGPHEAAISKTLSNATQNTLEESEYRAHKLRREYDALRAANKVRSNELGDVTLQLGTIEKWVRGRREESKSGGPVAVRSLEEKRAGVMEQQQAAAHTANMYGHMLSRLKTENTLMDAEIEELGIQLRAVNSSSEASRLSLHKAQSEKLRATAQVHALCRHVETARNARATKLVEVHALLEAQESRAREIEEREEKRKVAVELPRADLDDDGEDRLKQLFMVRKVYLNMLTRRTRDDTRRLDELSKAYQRIRTATGLQKAEDIVHKYSTREATHADLQAEMRSARDRLQALADERKRLIWAVDDAAVSAASTSSGAGTGASEGGSGVEARAMHNAIEDYESRLAEGNKRTRDAESRFNRIAVTLEDVRCCTARLMGHLGLDVTPITGLLMVTAAPQGSKGGESTRSSTATMARQRSRASSSHTGVGVHGSASSMLGGTKAGGGASSGLTRAAAAIEARRQQAARSRTSSAFDDHITADDDDAELANSRGDPHEKSGRAGSAGISSRSNITARVVEPEALEQALRALDTRIGQVLSHVAAVIEAEEAAHMSIAKTGKGRGRRGSLSAGAISMGAASPTSGAGGTGSNNSGGRRLSVADVSEKASATLHDQLNAAAGDGAIQPGNLRVELRPSTPEPGTGQDMLYGPAGQIMSKASAVQQAKSSTMNSISSRKVEDIVGSAAADDGHQGKSVDMLTALLKGQGASAVLDRQSLKRMASMVAREMTETSARGSNGVDGPSAAAAATTTRGKGSRSNAAGGGGKSPRSPRA